MVHGADVNFKFHHRQLIFYTQCQTTNTTLNLLFGTAVFKVFFSDSVQSQKKHSPENCTMFG